MNIKNKWTSRFPKTIVIVIAIAIIVLPFWNVWAELIKKIHYHTRYHNEISYCQSIDGDRTQFEFVRAPRDDIRQYIFEVYENTMYDDIIPLLKNMKDYCEKHLKSGVIYQVVLSSDVSVDYPVGTPLVILTNQEPVTGETKGTMVYVHLCCLETSSKWGLAHITGTAMEFVEEVVLCGEFDSLDPLTEWDKLELCLYNGRSYFTYEVFDQPLISDEVWQQMKSSMDYDFEVADHDDYSIVEPYLGAEYS